MERGLYCEIQEGAGVYVAIVNIDFIRSVTALDYLKLSTKESYPNHASFTVLFIACPPQRQCHKATVH